MADAGAGVYSLANNLRKVNLVNATKTFYTKMKDFDFNDELMGVWNKLRGVGVTGTGQAFKTITTDIRAALKNRINHICKMEFEQTSRGYKFSGCHSRVALDELGSNARIEITIPPNAEGVYEAKVFAKGPDGIEIPKTGNEGKSTFFPDTWGEAKILDEVEFAVKNNRGKVPTPFSKTENMYYGFSKDGKIKIEFYYNEQTGQIPSFFPSLNNY